MSPHAHDAASMGAIERTDIAAYDYDAVAGYAYDEFAECTCDENLIGFDRETNLHYNDQRDGYDSGTGRYTQPDPLGVLTTSVLPPTMGLNHLYGYADQNPLSNVDPTGEMPFVPFLLLQGATRFAGAAAFNSVMQVTNMVLNGQSLRCYNASQALMAGAFGLFMPVSGYQVLSQGANLSKTIQTMSKLGGPALGGLAKNQFQFNATVFGAGQLANIGLNQVGIYPPAWRPFANSSCQCD